MPYRGAHPPKGSGFHRYVFMVFKQAGQIELTKELQAKFLLETNRPKFEIRNFAAEHNFSPRPVAGNFYRAQNTDS
ncbi:hypothetical protein BV898_02656 [Hypsibius exemplaris]|uniref:OV-16 antigen n=1 Tax=Hypsibius exemplaris TaxID=2072580 RepID=A0A1W0X7N5_HYPEX|nr:hypothetical protein BV898_02656 [Hypsibius exemplaris]